jgi:predicted amidohydrolase YtcJ
MATLLSNARFFTNPSHAGDHNAAFRDSMVVRDGRIEHIGSSADEAIARARATASSVIDLGGRVVTPGFIDAHMHLLHFGTALRKLELKFCTSLDEIRRAIRQFAQAHPDAPRILCKGWMYASTDRIGLASMIDDLDTRPIFIEASDLHSTWCNTAALKELRADSLPDPPGGAVHRDDSGRPSGLLAEAAHFDYVWTFLADAMTTEEKHAALEEAVKAYSEGGYTGIVDMAMDDNTWAVVRGFCDKRKPPVRIAAHWLVPYTEDEKAISDRVTRAIELHAQFNATSSPELYIAGVKMIGDGIVDGCTAALHQPYSHPEMNADPIWPKDPMLAVVQRADAAGLQCAIHAIGDRTVTQAIDVLATVASPEKRHRIEHLELTTPEDARRLGELGITASVQPVHLDPAGFTAWPSLIGAHRCQRAFAYKEFLDGGAPLALGTDSPTAKHLPLPNLYNATTRRSAMDPNMTERVNEQYALPLASAVTAATAGAAYSCRTDQWRGSLKPGYTADFVVLDFDWNPDTLLQGRVLQTWFGGRKVFDSST